MHRRFLMPLSRSSCNCRSKGKRTAKRILHAGLARAFGVSLPIWLTIMSSIDFSRALSRQLLVERTDRWLPDDQISERDQPFQQGDSMMSQTAGRPCVSLVVSKFYSQHFTETFMISVHRINRWRLSSADKTVPIASLIM